MFQIYPSQHLFRVQCLFQIKSIFHQMKYMVINGDDSLTAILALGCDGFIFIVAIRKEFS